MKTESISLILCCLLPFGSASGADGVSPVWTAIAEADRTLMGDYEGEWIDAPMGHYYNINKPLAAQVINIRDGEYQLRFFQEHDRRADPYFEGPGKFEDGEIRFSGDGWSGTVTKDGLSGTGKGHGGDVRFRLKHVTRSSPSLGAKPPANALVLFDGRNFDGWQHSGDRPVTWNLLGNGAMEVRSARSDEDRNNGPGGG